MSNIVEPQITETKPSKFGDFIKNNPNIVQELIGNTSSTPVLCKDGTTQNQLSSPNAKYADACVNNGGRADLKTQQQAQLEIAKQQAMMQEASQMGYIGLTDKVFGKQSNFVSGGGNRFIILPTYIILGAVVGRYVAKNMKKSTTLGMVVGGLAPLLAYQLSIEYDRKNMPKQEPRQKVSLKPTPMPKMIIEPFGMPLDPSFQELSKTPNEFVVKSNGFNTRYYKDVKESTSFFSSFIPDLYKQPFSTNGISGVQPTKISTREFLDAYNEFLKQPK